MPDYLLKSPSNREGHHLACLSLDVVMDNFTTFASPNCRDFVSVSKHFVCNEMGTMDSIMALKGHSSFKYVHGSRFLGHFKDKMFVFTMSVNLPRSVCKLKVTWRIFG